MSCWTTTKQCEPCTFIFYCMDVPYLQLERAKAHTPVAFFDLKRQGIFYRPISLLYDMRANPSWR